MHLFNTHSQPLPIPRRQPQEPIWIMTYGATLRGYAALKTILGFDFYHRSFSTYRSSHKNSHDSPEVHEADKAYESFADFRILANVTSQHFIDAVAADGAQLRSIDHLHAKAIIYPRRRLVIAGSFNLTWSSFHRNIENFFCLRERQADDFVQQFSRLWEQAHPPRPTIHDEDQFFSERASSARELLPDVLSNTSSDASSDIYSLQGDPETYQNIQNTHINTHIDARESDQELIHRETSASFLTSLQAASFQARLIEEIFQWLVECSQKEITSPAQQDDSFVEGKILNLPTGAGKTLVAVEAIRAFLQIQQPVRRPIVVWVSDRLLVLEQAIARALAQHSSTHRLQRFGRPAEGNLVGLYDSRRTRAVRSMQDCDVIFTSKGQLHFVMRELHAALSRRDFTSNWYIAATVIDECHRYHEHSTEYRAWEEFLCRLAKQQKYKISRLGLSATPKDPAPSTLSPPVSPPTDTLWQFPYFGHDISDLWLQEQGYLSKIADDSIQVHIPEIQFFFRGHDWERELEARIQQFNHPAVNEEARKQYQRICVGQKHHRILLFAVSIEHANVLKTQYFATDDQVRVLHSGMSRQRRAEALAWFNAKTAVHIDENTQSNSSDCRMLITVLLAAEGTDMPQIDCLFLLRPTLSDTLRRQMRGRGLRGPLVGGTATCTLIDFTYQFIYDGSAALQNHAGPDKIALSTTEQPADPHINPHINPHVNPHVNLQTPRRDIRLFRLRKAAKTGDDLLQILRLCAHLQIPPDDLAQSCFLSLETLWECTSLTILPLALQSYLHTFCRRYQLIGHGFSPTNTTTSTTENNAPVENNLRAGNETAVENATHRNSAQDDLLLDAILEQ